MSLLHKGKSDLSDNGRRAAVVWASIYTTKRIS